MPIKTNKPVVPLESSRIDNVDPNSSRGQSHTFKRVKRIVLKVRLHFLNFNFFVFPLFIYLPQNQRILLT